MAPSTSLHHRRVPSSTRREQCGIITSRPSAGSTNAVRWPAQTRDEPVADVADPGPVEREARPVGLGPLDDPVLGEHLRLTRLGRARSTVHRSWRSETAKPRTTACGAGWRCSSATNARPLQCTAVNQPSTSRVARSRPVGEVQAVQLPPRAEPGRRVARQHRGAEEPRLRRLGRAQHAVELALPADGPRRRVDRVQGGAARPLVPGRRQPLARDRDDVARTRSCRRPSRGTSPPRARAAAVRERATRRPGRCRGAARTSAVRVSRRSLWTAPATAPTTTSAMITANVDTSLTCRRRARVVGGRRAAGHAGVTGRDRPAGGSAADGSAGGGSRHAGGWRQSEGGTSAGPSVVGAKVAGGSQRSGRRVGSSCVTRSCSPGRGPPRARSGAAGCHDGGHVEPTSHAGRTGRAAQALPQRRARPGRARGARRARPAAVAVDGLLDRRAGGRDRRRRDHLLHRRRRRADAERPARGTAAARAGPRVRRPDGREPRPRGRPRPGLRRRRSCSRPSSPPASWCSSGWCGAGPAGASPPGRADPPRRARAQACPRGRTSPISFQPVASIVSLMIFGVALT